MTPIVTSRQRQVWEKMAMGYSTKQISSQLGIHCKTVGKHREALYAATGAHNLADVTRLAVAHGLITIKLLERL